MLRDRVAEIIRECRDCQLDYTADKIISLIIAEAVPEEINANLYANKGFEKLNNYKVGWNECRAKMMERLGQR